MRCVAVGFSTDNNTYLELALSYNTTDGGVTWSAPIVPPANGTIDNILNAVSCSTSGLYCTAVGGTNFQSTTTTGNLSYTSINGGTTWSNPTLPEISTGSLNNLINGIFCDSTGTDCAAVGFTTDSIFSYFTTNFSSNNGINWSSIMLLSTQGYTSPSIGAISGSR
jgi:hypothetical protein